jgi:hypothetical protein
MKPEIENIFDHNACLTRRQIKDYISAVMATEESEAVELHFNSCPLCREAMDGYLAHSDKALEALATLDTNFLKDQIGAIQQTQEAKPVPIMTRPSKKKRSLVQRPGFHSIIPVLLAVGAFALFQRELSKPVPRKQQLARLAKPAAVQEEPVRSQLPEARTEAPPVRKYPEAPVGSNLKLRSVDVLPGQADSQHPNVIAAPVARNADGSLVGPSADTQKPKVVSAPTVSRYPEFSAANNTKYPTVSRPLSDTQKPSAMPVSTVNRYSETPVGKNLKVQSAGVPVTATTPKPDMHPAASAAQPKSKMIGPVDDFFDEPADAKPKQANASPNSGGAVPARATVQPAEKPKERIIVPPVEKPRESANPDVTPSRESTPQPEKAKTNSNPNPGQPGGNTQPGE